MNIHADGGAPLAILIILICGLALGLAFWTRRPAPAPATEIGDEAPRTNDNPEQQETATAPARRQERDGVDERTSNSPSLRGVLCLLGYLLVIALALGLAYWLILAFWNWSPAGTGTTQVAPPVAGQPSQAGSTKQTATSATDQCPVGGEITLASDDDKPRWIRVRDGCKLVYDAVGQTSIGRQCSDADEKPPQDADGQQYWCPVGASITSRWFRPYIYDRSIGVVTFRYHYEAR